MTTVLFICIQNSCRSQMAEAIFNHLALEGIRAISAGSEPATKVDPLALGALKEAGIETNTLSPKLLTREIAQRADKIITMGCPEACPAVGKPMEDWGTYPSQRPTFFSLLSANSLSGLNFSDAVSICRVCVSIMRVVQAESARLVEGSLEGYTTQTNP